MQTNLEILLKQVLIGSLMRNSNIAMSRFHFLHVTMWSIPNNILMDMLFSSLCGHISILICMLGLTSTQWKPLLQARKLLKYFRNQWRCVQIIFYKSTVIWWSDFKFYQTICKECGNDDKDWNIPKMHTHVHTFPDIKAKGVTVNYDTKPSEGTHGAPKATYKLNSNGKEFEDLVRNQERFIA